MEVSHRSGTDSNNNFAVQNIDVPLPANNDRRIDRATGFPQDIIEANPIIHDAACEHRPSSPNESSCDEANATCHTASMSGSASSGGPVLGEGVVKAQKLDRWTIYAFGHHINLNLLEMKKKYLTGALLLILGLCVFLPLGVEIHDRRSEYSKVSHASELNIRYMVFSV